MSLGEQEGGATRLAAIREWTERRPSWHHSCGCCEDAPFLLELVDSTQAYLDVAIAAANAWQIKYEQKCLSHDAIEERVRELEEPDDIYCTSECSLLDHHCKLPD